MWAESWRWTLPNMVHLIAFKATGDRNLKERWDFFAKKWKIKLIKLRPYHPQPRGNLERSHKRLRKKIMYDPVTLGRKGINWAANFDNYNWILKRRKQGRAWMENSFRDLLRAKNWWKRHWFRLRRWWNQNENWSRKGGTLRTYGEKLIFTAQNLTIEWLDATSGFTRLKYLNPKTKFLSAKDRGEDVISHKTRVFLVKGTAVKRSKKRYI